MRRWSAVLILTLAFSIIAVAKKPKLDYDKSVDFHAYKTYAWVEGTSAPRPGVHFQIRGAIDLELKRAGLAEVAPEKADLLVTYFAIGDTDINVSTVYTPTVTTMSGPYPYSGTMWVTGYIGSSTASYFKKATLIVSIADNKQQTVIWRSVVKDVVKQGDSKLIDQINSTIGLMFKDFPPRRK